jgi:hypothetical protein
VECQDSAEHGLEISALSDMCFSLMFYSEYIIIIIIITVMGLDEYVFSLVLFSSLC